MDAETTGPDPIKEISALLNKIETEHGWKNLNKAYSKILHEKKKDAKTTRPTPIDLKIYTSFANKCRMDGQEVGDKLTALCELYTEKGEELFN